MKTECEGQQVGSSFFCRIWERFRNIWRATKRYFNRDQDDTDGVNSASSSAWRCFVGFYMRIFGRSPSTTKRPDYPRIELPAYDLFFEYDMSHRRRGIAMIFNHETFTSSDKKKRLGTDKDRDRLTAALNTFCFDVKIFNDLSRNEVLQELKTVSLMDHSENDCLMITIMTHGDIGVISSYDRDYGIEKVTSFFTDENCPSLKGKPRLFFVQACRGSKLDDGHVIRIFERDKYKLHRRKRNISTDITLFASSETESESEEELEQEEMAFDPPIHQDFLIVRSTMQHHLSFRNSTEGSWFIQDLCRELEVNGAACDILNLLTHVNLSVSERESKGPQAINNKKQILCISSRLTKLLRLNKRQQIDQGQSTNF